MDRPFLSGRTSPAAPALKVKGKRWAGLPEAVRDCSCRKSVGRVPHEQAKNIETRFLWQSSHRIDRYLVLVGLDPNSESSGIYADSLVRSAFHLAASFCLVNSARNSCSFWAIYFL